MAGYLVACVQWHNTDAIPAYGAIVRDSLVPFGGKYLARGSPEATIEGSQAPQRLAIVEFPTTTAAREWAASDAYAPARAIREQNATTHWIIVLEGMP
jgi:uncharacterized protein (DUF1330 family)